MSFASPLPSSPHAHNNKDVRKVMMQVQLAALPAFAMHIYLFGMGIVVQWFLAVVTYLMVESIMLHLRGRPIKPFLTDLSAMITVTGLVFCIPPTAPWWLIVSGSAFALIFGKHLYGGLGYNPFNPAMLGYAFLIVSFPVPMTQWLMPSDISGHFLDLSQAAEIIFTGAIQSINYDLLTGATPLDLMHATHQTASAEQFWQSKMEGPFFGFNSWAMINFAFLIGGLYLLWNRTIRWQFPIGFLGTLFMIAWVFHQLDPNTYPPASLVLLTGGTMLAAFFIITDPVSASTTPAGRFIYACGIGALVYVIRTWGAFPDGLAFAILLMNIAVPLIDQYTQPRVFGHDH